MLKEIGIIGDDLRINYLKKMYKDEGFEVIESYKYCDTVITSIPFSRDGVYLTNTDIKINDVIEYIKSKNEKNKELDNNSIDNKLRKTITIISGSISSEMRNKLENNSIKYIDILEFEDIAILNSIPTAEGAIFTAMSKTTTTLCNSKCLVLGYGRIGKVLSKMLNGIGSDVYVEARKESDLALINAMGYNCVDLNKLDIYLDKFDYIFNTIPTEILNKKRLDNVKKEVCIIDLASKYGFDYEYAKTLGLNSTIALSLPSKVAPQSAAKYLKAKIDIIVKEC